MRAGANEGLFSDNFDDENVADWPVYVGAWNGTGGTMNANGGGRTGSARGPFVDFDASFRVIMAPSSTDWVGFQFRKTSASDEYNQSGYMVYYRKNGGLDLYKANAGVIASVSTGRPLDSWHEVTVSARGLRIRVWVDGVLMIDKTDTASYTIGYIGFRSHYSSGSFDGLKLTGNAGTTYYTRGAGGEVLAEYDAAGSLLAEYAYANGERVALLRPGQQVQYYLSDGLGSARRLYPNSSWAADYFAYGQVEAQTGTEGESRFGFTGHETDFGSGLVYAGARYYDPEIGRWLQVDPLAGEYPGWSPYNYTLSNPLLLVDPTGKAACCSEDEDPDALEWFLRFESAYYSTLWSKVKPREPFTVIKETVQGVSAVIDDPGGVYRAAKNKVGATVNGIREGDPETIGNAWANVIWSGGEALGTKGAGTVSKADQGVEIVQRSMAKAELESTLETGLVRGGWGGTHWVSTAISTDPLRARQRLALGKTPEVLVTMEVPGGVFSPAAKVAPANKMPGGGLERTATGPVRATVLKVYVYKQR